MDTRKHHLDWLRVLAFGLLILFHVGCLYAPWDYNLKSPRPVPQAGWWLGALGAWRMALLFFISGVACRFLIGKLGAGGFARDRLRRLLPVILFGMLVVIPPQTFVELRAKGVTRLGYLDFWVGEYLAADQTLVAPLHKTMPTWDHLWFLVYLLVYALLFALVAAAMRPGPPSARTSPWALPVLLVGPALWLSFANLAILRFPLTHALVDDGAGHLKWLGIFAVGAIAATCAPFWSFVRDRAATLLVIAVALLVARSFTDEPVNAVLSGPYAWATICALCGFAARRLDRPSDTLTHLNEAVLPVYVLHQPILLITAFFLFPWRLPVVVEAIVLTAVTAAGSFAIYETLIRPFGPMRFLFGLKPRVSARRSSSPTARGRPTGSHDRCTRLQPDAAATVDE